MAELVNARSSDSAHWYRASDGSPCYEVEYASKKRAGQLRAVTLRDAKKMKLVPSVTTILKVIADPGLTAWLQGQAIGSALTLTHMPDEPDDEFIRRVLDDSRRRSREAAEWGTRVHHAIERALCYACIAPPNDLAASVAPAVEWLRENVTIDALEQCIPADLGYGGRLDGLCHDDIGPFIYDIKTQATKPDKRFSVWPKSRYQLGAYAQAKAAEIGVGIRRLILFISSTEIGRFEARWIPENTYRSDIAVFDAAFTIWRAQNKYDPRGLVQKQEPF